MTTPHSQLDTPALELPFGAATGHDSAARLGAQIWAIGLASAHGHAGAVFAGIDAPLRRQARTG